jgi:hypothetical protein
VEVERQIPSGMTERKARTRKDNDRSRSFAPLRMTTRKTRATTAIAWQQ